MKKVEYNVVGMTCSGCENSVKRVVSRLNGIVKVEANHSLNNVVVSYQDKQVDDKKIMVAISKLGYEVKLK